MSQPIISMRLKDGEWTVVRKDADDGGVFVDRVRSLSPEALAFVASRKPVRRGRSVQYGSMDDIPGPSPEKAPAAPERRNAAGRLFRRMRRRIRP